MALSVLSWRCWCCLAPCGGARGWPGTLAPGDAGHGKCRVIATCARDRPPGEPPGDTHGSSSGPTSPVAHGTPVARRWESPKKCLPRDHAQPQPQKNLAFVAKMRHADGAHVLPRHAGLGPPRPGVGQPAAVPPASAAAGAGIRGPGNNADSNSAAGTCVHSLCADRRACAVVGNGSLAYHDDGPRERILPRDSPGRTRQRSPRALIKSQQPSYTSVHELDRERNGL